MKIAAFLPQLVIHTRDEAVLRIRLEFPISPTFEEGFQFVLNFGVGAAQEFSTDKNNGRLMGILCCFWQVIFLPVVGLKFPRSHFKAERLAAVVNAGVQ